MRKDDLGQPAVTLPVAFILSVTPEWVVHSTCMGTRDLGSSLTDNLCVI